MAKIKGICRNEECELCDEIQEVEKSNFVCEKCGKPLMQFGGGSKPSVMKTHGKLFALIGGAVVVIAAIVGAVVALSGSKTPNSIDLNTAQITLKEGESKTLEVLQLKEEKYKGLQLKWEAQSEENTNAIEVSQDGKVTALHKGKAKVTVCLADKEEVSASCDVVVEPKPGPEPPQTTQLVAVKPATASLKVGETLKLEPLLEPANATATIVWTSANSAVASVASDGTVTGVKAGTTTITGTLNDKQVTVTVTVTEDKKTGRTTDGGGTTVPPGPKVPYGKYQGPANGNGGVITVTRSYSLDLRTGTGEAIELQPGDKIQNTRFKNGDLREGVWVHGSQRMHFNR